MFKKLVFVLFVCTLPLHGHEVASDPATMSIEKYGLRIHVNQSSVESEKICDLAKIEPSVLVGVEITNLLVLMADSLSVCERLKAIIEKENYAVEIIKLHRVDYTLTPDQMAEAKAGRLCIMQDRRKCTMRDQTTWSWQPIEAGYCHEGSQG